MDTVQKIAAKRAPDATMPNKKYAQPGEGRPKERFTPRQKSILKGRFVGKTGGVEAPRGPND